MTLNVALLHHNFVGNTFTQEKHHMKSRTDKSHWYSHTKCYSYIKKYP